MKSKIVFFISIFTMLSLILSALPAQARQGDATSPAPNLVPVLQQDPPQNVPCSNLDVVFIIEESYSMRNPSRAFGSDPTEQRRYGVEAMIRLLKDMAYHHCSQGTYRIGIVSFGKDAELSLDLTPIKAADLSQYEQLVQQLLKARDENVKQFANSSEDADPTKAFARAYNVLNNPRTALPTTPGVNNKRAIIFVTDGIPCTKEIGCFEKDKLDAKPLIEGLKLQIDRDFKFSQSLLKLEKCINAQLNVDNKFEIARITPEKITKCYADNPVTADDYKQSTYIWILLIDSYDFRVNTGGATGQVALLEKTYKDIAESHAGRLISSPFDKPQNIPDEFRRVLSQLGGTRATPLDCGDFFAVNPYLTTTTFTFFKYEVTNKVTLSYKANGKDYEIVGNKQGVNGGFEVQSYQAFGTNEIYVFNNPYPGIWYLKADKCEGVNASYQTVEFVPKGIYQTNVPPKVPQYDIGDLYDPGQPYYVEYQMRGNDDKTVLQADHDKFKVNLNITVTSPDGKQQLPMEWKPAEKLFRAKEPLKVKSVGDYKIEISGTAAEHKGVMTVKTDDYNKVFDAERSLFKHPASQFIVTKVEPFVITATITATSPSAITIHASPFEKGFKTFLPLVDLIVNPISPISVEVSLVGRDGKPLNASPNDILVDPNDAFKATINEQPVTLRPASVGKYVGTAAGLGSAAPITFEVELKSKTKQDYRPDKRTASATATTATRTDTLWTTPLTYQIAEVSGILLAMIILAIVIYSRLNPVTGELIFEVGTTSIASFPLGSGWRATSISRGSLKAEPTLMLRSLKAWNSNSQPSSIDFEATDDNGNAYNGTLGHGEIFNYTGGMTIRYESLHHSE